MKKAVGTFVIVRDTFRKACSRRAWGYDEHGAYVGGLWDSLAINTCNGARQLVTGTSPEVVNTPLHPLLT